MEQSPQEANRFSASQEISHILRNPEVPYRIVKCLPPILSQLSFVILYHTLYIYIYYVLYRIVWYCIVLYYIILYYIILYYIIVLFYILLYYTV
jgi:hypothetical protein